MDVIYPYKSAAFDFDLRYSLRSLANLPHDNVIIAGDRPMIASDAVKFVPVPPISDRYQSSAANILAACEASDSEEIIVMNDDIFVLEPWSFTHENRGTIADYLRTGGAHGGYRVAIEATSRILISSGVHDPLFFGLHTPTVYSRRLLIDLIREYRGQTVLLRTLYHNLHSKPSVRVEDVKLHSWPRCEDPKVGSVLSVADAVSGEPGFRSWIADRLPDPSIYERRGRCLILGRGENVWDDLAAKWAQFDAVIASPEAAEHWPGQVLAIANDDDQAAVLAQSYGFDDVIWCGVVEV